MKIKLFLCLCATAVVLLNPLSASAQFYRQTNLVSDIPGLAKLTDPRLINPWGVSRTSTSPFWVSNAGTGFATLYTVNPTTEAVTQSALVVSIPGPPSGQVANTTNNFVVTAGGG